MMINLPIRQVFGKPDVVGQMIKWAIELSEFDFRYKPRGPIKDQVFTNFIAELTPTMASSSFALVKWILSVGGAFNVKGRGVRIILEGPDGVLLEQSLRFSFNASNNHAEYEALITRILLATKMGIGHLTVKSDSQLVVGQVTNNFQAKDPHSALYLRYVKTLAELFASFELTHVSRRQNSRADLLSKLARSTNGASQCTIIQETLKTLILTISGPKGEGLEVFHISVRQTWMTPYLCCIADNILPLDKQSAKNYNATPTNSL
ncbi:uncharacterized protein [Phaseolus vulgaris]|uniref:uncharacterized protein n=1 Tax=Phaseolus vulgaris TaxID=3885 RepID=UPI0035CAE117